MGGAGSAPGHRTATARGTHGRVVVRLGLASLVLLLLSCTLATSEQEQEVQDNTEEQDWCQEEEIVDCAQELLSGQYLCTSLDVDSDTQQLRGCRQVNGTGKAPQQCTALPGIVCQTSCNSTFTRWESCNWTNGYHFDTALLLSVFLGMFGIDRFYLGYPAIGLLKFSTLGFFFIGHLVDIILIASQTLGPADGSHYIINYFGAGLTKVQVTEDTYRREQQDWY